MNHNLIEIEWPNGGKSWAEPGGDWLKEACKAGVSIPTGCLQGSCGACEIEVNGNVLRACISSIPKCSKKFLKVEFAYDPYW